MKLIAPTVSILAICSFILTSCSYRKENALDELRIDDESSSLYLYSIPAADDGPVNQPPNQALNQIDVRYAGIPPAELKPRIPVVSSGPRQTEYSRNHDIVYTKRVSAIPPLPKRNPAYLTEEEKNKVGTNKERAVRTTTLTEIMKDLESLPEKGQRIDNAEIVADKTILSVFDQGRSENDRSITARIRKTLIADPTLSFKAKNIAIITLGGKVHLQGFVDTVESKYKVEEAAQRIAPQDQIINNILVGEIRDYDIEIADQ